MAEIPPAMNTISNLIDEWYEKHAAAPRPHLGASTLGHHCDRWLWLSFRLAVIPKFPGRVLRLFERGQNEESVIVRNLKRIGIDILNPVQPSALGDLPGLKQKYGDRLSFCGAIDTHRVLPYGTVEEVRAEVKQRISELGPGGGYILSSVHSILVDVPPENVLAMADAAQEFGVYPLEI